MTIFRGQPPYDELIDKIDEFLKEGMLLKVDWEELKKRVNAHYESEWKRAIDNPCCAVDDPLARDLYGSGYVQLHTINARTKKLKAVAKKHPDSPFIRVVQAGEQIIADISEVAPKMEKLKGMIKTKDEIKEIKNPKPRPKIDPEATDAIKNVMTQISEGVVEQVKQSHIAQQWALIESYEEAVKNLPDGKSASPFKMYPRNEFARYTLGRLYKEDWQTRTHHRVEDFNELIEKAANKHAHFVRDKFVFKQVSKLPAIATGLGKIAKVSGHLGLHGVIEANLHIEFENGAKFDARTKVVQSTSVYGKPFFRYPTTFHNVVNSEGRELGKILSEEEMQEFAGVIPHDSKHIPEGP